MKEVPDEPINYLPQYCNDCGQDLQESLAVLEEKRQEVRIPPVQAQYVEHHYFEDALACKWSMQ